MLNSVPQELLVNDDIVSKMFTVLFELKSFVLCGRSCSRSVVLLECISGLVQAGPLHI